MSWHPECYNARFGTFERGSPTKFESRCQAGAQCKFGGTIHMGERYVWKRSPTDTGRFSSGSAQRAQQNKQTLGEMIEKLKQKNEEKASANPPTVLEDDLKKAAEALNVLKKAAEALNVTFVKCMDDAASNDQLHNGMVYMVDTDRAKLEGSSEHAPKYYLVGIADPWHKSRFEVVAAPEPIKAESLKDALKEAVQAATEQVKEAKQTGDKLEEAMKAAEVLKPILQKMVGNAVDRALDRNKLIDELSLKVLDNIASVTTTTVEIKKIDGTTKNIGLQHRQFPILLKAIAARCNVWLAGPSASGKTTAAEQVSKALDLPFRFTGAVGDAYALLGYNDANGRYVRTQFREAWEHGGVFLWDEVDASDPNALLAFNAALANDVAPFPDGIIKKHQDCVLIAAANTYGHGATHEYVGRLKMDAAFLKRFAFLSWDIDEQLEMATAPNKNWTKRVQEVRKKVKDKGLRVLVTPRESYIGARLLEAGIPQSTVEQMTIKSGMSDVQWASIA